MQVINNEQVLTIDCDDTLVLWKDPVDGEETVLVKDPYDGQLVRLVVHKPHVKLLKDRSARGCAIVVWSQSGSQWALAVVEALGVQDYVTLVISKPFAYVDDLPINEWLPKRTYLDPGIKYGSNDNITNQLGPLILGNDISHHSHPGVDMRGVLNGR